MQWKNVKSELQAATYMQISISTPFLSPKTPVGSPCDSETGRGQVKRLLLLKKGMQFSRLYLWIYCLFWHAFLTENNLYLCIFLSSAQFEFPRLVTGLLESQIYICSLERAKYSHKCGWTNCVPTTENCSEPCHCGWKQTSSGKWVMWRANDFRWPQND